MAPNSDRDPSGSNDRLIPYNSPYKKIVAAGAAVLSLANLTGCNPESTPQTVVTVTATPEETVSPEVIEPSPTTEPTTSVTPGETDTVPGVPEIIPDNVMTFEEAWKSYYNLMDNDVYLMTSRLELGEVAQYLSIATEAARMNAYSYLIYYNARLAKEANPNIMSVDNMSAKHLYQATQLPGPVAMLQTESGSAAIESPEKLKDFKSRQITTLFYETGMRIAQKMPFDVNTDSLDVTRDTIDYASRNSEVTAGYKISEESSESAGIRGATVIYIEDVPYDATILSVRDEFSGESVNRLIVHIPVGKAMLPSDTPAGMSTLKYEGAMQFDEAGTPMTHDGKQVKFPIWIGDISEETVDNLLTQTK